MLLSFSASDSNDTLPSVVAEATTLARQLSFPVEKDPLRSSSCIPAMGHLLRLLVASKPGGQLAEAGTGCGVGTAWMSLGMKQRAKLTTVEMDETRAGVADRLFKPNEDVRVLHGDSCALLPKYAPYDLIFVDGFGPTRALLEETGKLLTSMLKIGGIVIFDDVRPSSWLEEDVSGSIKRAYLHSAKELTCIEIRLTHEWSALVGTRVA
jgi:predicted O-methyltransferase YrrM